jgi:hypothetical protein
MPAPAKGAQIVQKSEPSVQFQRGSFAAIVAVLAMKIASLRYMPLKREYGR